MGMSPGSVWLCAPETDDGGSTEPIPIWARRTVSEFSPVGRRVVIRALCTYPGLVGDVVALTAAATAAGRYPLALLPTPASAARTRAALPALLAGLESPGSTPDPDAGPEHDNDRPADLPHDLLDDGTEHGAHPGRAGRREEGSEEQGRFDGVRVGVGRRRPATESGPAELVVVLAGPIVAAARVPRRRITARLISSWARVLRPGGLLVLLRPAELGSRRGRPESHGQVVRAAQDAGLSYLQHIVLLHVPTTEHGLARPASTRRPHAPFWPVHTDALVFATAPDPTAPTPTTSGGPIDRICTASPGADRAEIVPTPARSVSPSGPDAGRTPPPGLDPPTIPILAPPPPHLLDPVGNAEAMTKAGSTGLGLSGCGHGRDAWSFGAGCLSTSGVRR
jgi:hypothetical protein